MQRTLMILKPDALRKNIVGDVLRRVEDDGLELEALKMTRLTERQARHFYAEHEDQPFFDGLVEFMTSGPVVAGIVAGEEAISRLRTLMGATDPAEAAPGTIRAEYAGELPENIIHGSDSPGSAEREIGFFFSRNEALHTRE